MHVIETALNSIIFIQPINKAHPVHFPIIASQLTIEKHKSTLPPSVTSETQMLKKTIAKNCDPAGFLAHNPQYPHGPPPWCPKLTAE
jgi:hypothetical protein